MFKVPVTLNMVMNELLGISKEYTTFLQHVVYL